MKVRILPPLENETTRSVARLLNEPMERIEVILRKGIQSISQELRKGGMKVPTNPQEEAELIHNLVRKHFG